MNNYQHGQISKLKLVIWDLDETLWKGTIDDGDLPKIPERHIDLIKALTDHGIVNSICSKNNKDKVKDILTDKGIWELFVFPSIDWSAKGNRIKRMLDEIGLRAVNTLFIDDNHLNIEEVEFCVPGIMTAYPDVVEILLDEVKTADIKVDTTHKRLKQYKVLEEKAEEKSNYGSAKDFLLSCHIKLDIHTRCVEEEPRIYELIHRSNQLNFTKVRSSEDEVKAMLVNPDYHCGTVWVNDRFGDYGMVGFYAIKDGKAEHFLFSCRTIGMGIEQYVFQILGCPEITVVGEVIAELGSKEPLEWINVDVNETFTKKPLDSVTTSQKVLLLGGCDLEQTAYYLEQSGVKFDSRFNYLANKRFECHPDSTVNLRTTIEKTTEEKQYILDNCIFNDKDVFFDILAGAYDVIIYSPLIDYSNGLYESRTREGIYTVYGNKDFPQINSVGYMNEEEQNEFNKEFAFRGGVSAQMFKDNLEWLISILPQKTNIILMNAAEIDFPHPMEPDRYLTHIEMNKVLAEVSARHSNSKILDVARIITNPSDFADSIRHYNRKIYYQIANEIVSMLKHYGAVDEAIEIDKSMLGLKGKLIHLKNRKEEGRLRDDIHAEVKSVLNKLGLLSFTYKTREMLSNMCGGGGGVKFFLYTISSAVQLDRRCTA